MARPLLVLVVLSQLLACDEGEPTSDAGSLLDAFFETGGSDGGPSDARSTDGESPLDVGTDAGTDAGPPPPVFVRDDGSFDVLERDGTVRRLCGCGDDSLPFALAPRFDAVVGLETTLYFDNLIEADGDDFEWTVWVPGLEGAPPVRPSQPGRWTLMAATAFSGSLFIVATDPDSGEAVGVGQAAFRIHPRSRGEGQSISVLFLGDSTTAGGNYVRDVQDHFDDDVMGFVPVGTVSSRGVVHEGRSGWSIATYDADRDGENPFYGGSGFDFAHYLSNSGVEAPDYFVVHLGINDLFSVRERGREDSKVVRMLAQLDRFIESIHAAAPDTHVAVALTIVPSGTEFGFRANYPDLAWATREAYKPRIVRWARALVGHYAAREDVALVPINATLDRMLGFPHREGEGGRIEHTNAVHPRAQGYQQMGDMFYAWLKGQATE